MDFDCTCAFEPISVDSERAQQHEDSLDVLRMTALVRLWPWWLLWVAFVVYGSLVPLEYRPVPWSLAWDRLGNAPMLVLGIESRADWVANGVLYFPVGYLTTATLMGPRGSSMARKFASALAGGLFGMGLAVGVEFAQVFFPPRTVSLNDLLAETVGTWLGVLAALASAHRLRLLLGSIDIGGAQLAQRLAPAYALAYLALALFPYDLLLSAEEWAQKLGGDMVGLSFAATNSGGSWLSRAAKLGMEVLLIAPLGIWWASRQRPGTTRRHWGQPLLLGALIGLGIESAQLAIASGVSQGSSVLTRAAGFTVGAWAWQASRTLHVEELRAWLRRMTFPISCAYLPALALHHGWWRGPWLPPDQAYLRLQDEVRFAPFYYHYYTTEMQAVVSLIAVSLSYLPVAVLSWAWHQSRATAVTTAALLALLVELGKLVPSGSHPDPTNVLIAGVSTWIAHRLLTLSSIPRVPGSNAPR